MSEGVVEVASLAFPAPQVSGLRSFWLILNDIDWNWVPRGDALALSFVCFYALHDEVLLG